MDEHVAGDQQNQAQAHAHTAGAQTDDEGLGVEYLRDVALGRADGTQDADLLAALQHADIGDDADHDGGHHQRDGHKGHQHVADHVDDLGHRGHQGAHHIGVAHHLVILAICLGGGIVGVQCIHDQGLAVKVLRVDGNGAGVIEVGVAQALQVAVVGGGGGQHGGLHQFSQLFLRHVHVDGILEGADVDLQGIFHLAAQLGNVLLDGAFHLLADPGAHLLHGRIHGGAQLALQGLADLGRVALHHGLHGGGELLLQVGVGQQFTHGVGQQLLELLRLQVGGETPLFKVEDAVADDIVFVSLEHFLHKGLQGVRGDGEVQPGKGLAQVNVRQVLHPAQAVGQSVQIKLEIGCIYERGEVERPAAQVKSTIQIKVQGAGINGERVFEGVGIHREDRGKIQ